MYTSSRGDTQSSSIPTSGKLYTTAKLSSGIPITQKQQQFYQIPFQQIQQQQQPAAYQQPLQQQYYPLHFFQSPSYQPQQQHQQPMILVAQPTPPPQQLVLSSSATQQLLNYIKSNSQLSNQPQPQALAYTGPQPPTPTFGFQVVPAQPQYQTAYQVPQTSQFHTQPQIVAIPSSQANQPQSHLQSTQVQPQQIPYTVTAPTQETYTQPQAQPLQYPNIGSQFGSYPITQLSHINTLAQLTAHKFLPPYRSAAPIITGLENFTPEQQAQIKSQLSSGGPITPLQSNIAYSNDDISSTQQQQQQLGKAAQEQGSQDFSPSPEDKAGNQIQSTDTSSNYKSQFSKG